MVDFAGWEMPIQFAGILEEHAAVRERAGLFDVSHMGEVRLRGVDALPTLQRLTVNDASLIGPGRAQYTAMTTPEGGMIDDLLVYCLGPEEYLLVVNAGTTAKDVAWIREHSEGDVQIEDESTRWAQLAIQGPKAQASLAPLVDVDLDGIAYYRFGVTEIGGRQAIVSRTGYTGEDGFEIYLAPEQASGFADALLESGQPHGVQPIGLGARDTLRLEAGMLLYGTDMNEERTPLEAGLSWVVKLDKGEFIGREALRRQAEGGTAERLIGLVVEGRGVPRHGYPIHAAGAAVPDTGDDVRKPIGEVTGGTFSPTLKQGIGLAYVASSAAEVGACASVEVRGRQVPIRFVKPPFYKRQR